MTKSSKNDKAFVEEILQRIDLVKLFEASNKEGKIIEQLIKKEKEEEATLIKFKNELEKLKQDQKVNQQIRILSMADAVAMKEKTKKKTEQYLKQKPLEFIGLNMTVAEKAPEMPINYWSLEEEEVPKDNVNSKRPVKKKQKPIAWDSIDDVFSPESDSYAAEIKWLGLRTSMSSKSEKAKSEKVISAEEADSLIQDSFRKLNIE